jgi:hypothetical protein
MYHLLFFLSDDDFGILLKGFRAWEFISTVLCFAKLFDHLFAFVALMLCLYNCGQAEDGMSFTLTSLLVHSSNWVIYSIELFRLAVFLGLALQHYD